MRGLEAENTVFHVEEVKKQDGLIHHIGVFESSAGDVTFDEGTKVIQQVDPARRFYHSRLHSAGNLIFQRSEGKGRQRE